MEQQQQQQLQEVLLKTQSLLTQTYAGQNNEQVQQAEKSLKALARANERFADILGEIILQNQQNRDYPYTRHKFNNLII